MSAPPRWFSTWHELWRYVKSNAQGTASAEAWCDAVHWAYMALEALLFVKRIDTRDYGGIASTLEALAEATHVSLPEGLREAIRARAGLRHFPPRLPTQAQALAAVNIMERTFHLLYIPTQDGPLPTESEANRIRRCVLDGSERREIPGVTGAWQLFRSAQREGSVVDGTVIRFVNAGAIVELSRGVTGLLHVSEIADVFVHDPREWLSLGQPVRVRIQEYDADRRRIRLSRRGVTVSVAGPPEHVEPDRRSPLGEERGSVTDDRGLDVGVIASSRDARLSPAIPPVEDVNKHIPDKAYPSDDDGDSWGEAALAPPSTYARWSEDTWRVIRAYNGTLQRRRRETGFDWDSASLFRQLSGSEADPLLINVAIGDAFCLRIGIGAPTGEFAFDEVIDDLEEAVFRLWVQRDRPYRERLCATSARVRRRMALRGGNPFSAQGAIIHLYLPVWLPLAASVIFVVGGVCLFIVGLFHPISESSTLAGEQVDGSVYVLTTMLVSSWAVFLATRILVLSRHVLAYFGWSRDGTERVARSASSLAFMTSTAVASVALVGSPIEFRYVVLMAVGMTIALLELGPEDRRLHAERVARRAGVGINILFVVMPLAFVSMAGPSLLEGWRGVAVGVLGGLALILTSLAIIREPGGSN